jgi:hypothetical protein
VPDDGDWRLRGQEKYLANVTLRLRPWSSEKQNWDHDHCSFCWMKIWQRATGPDETNVAYSTLDGRDWICAECFADFQSRFGWVVES